MTEGYESAGAADSAAMPAVDAEEGMLWQTLRQVPDGAPGRAAAREALLQHYLPYARALSMQLYRNRFGNDAEFRDYCQFAIVGLLESIDRFDPARGASFKTFSTPRIRGAMLNGIETVSDRHEQAMLGARLRSERLASLTDGRAVRSRLPQAFATICEVAVAAAIGFMLEDTGMYDAQDVAQDTSCHGYRKVAWRQARASMQAAVRSLGERERKVITYHYFHGLVFDQIADIMGVTKGRISQLHRSALLSLRKRLHGETDKEWQE
ncbi:MULTISPECIES: sigma-70 family RNA polymerase sigma factor [Cupriavidus]